MKRHHIPRLAAAICLLIGLHGQAAAAPLRTTVDLCQGWRFLREDTPSADPGTAAFDDAAWEKVSLPHTVKAEPPTLGAKYFLGTCWYRLTLPVDPAWSGRRVALEFDGAMQQASIFVNGTKTGTHLGGYLPFTVDLTPHLAGHDRVTVALHLDNRGVPEFPPGSNRIDFGYYGGLYRPARLVVTGPVHITNAVDTGGGVFVRCASADAEKALVLAQTQVSGDGANFSTMAVEHVLLAPDGREVARQTATSVDGSFGSTFTVTKPQLWHPDHPWLYTLVSKLSKDGVACDETRTRCGLRSVAVTDEGFILNGRKVVLRGANRHMSFPWLGNAASDNLQYRDIRLLKEAGFNFLRLAHYPQSTATMDACDELGVMALVCTPGWQCFHDNDSFRTAAKTNIRQMVRWHRNHPSAVLWEVSLNETYGHDGFFEECSNIAKAEYPGGQILTCGDSHGCKRVSFYDLPYTSWEKFYERPLHPDSRHKVGLHREYGDYEFGGQSSTTRVPRGAGEEKLMLQAWNFQWSHNENLSWPWTAGDSIWAGIDTSSTFDEISRGLGSWWGPLDLYRLPKFSYYFFQSQRDPAVKTPGSDTGPMVRIAGYWTPRPSPTKTVVYSNCDEVELFLNGKSIGKRKPDNGPDAEYGAYLAAADPMYWAKNQDTDTATREAAEAARNRPAAKGKSIFDGGNCQHLDHPPFTFIPVTYEPGELKAVAYLGGKAVATHILRTPGAPAALRLRAATHGKPLRADGADAIFVYAEVVDAAGEIVPSNNPPVTFKLTGPGHLVMPPQSQNEAGIAPMLVQATTTPGTLSLTATAEGLPPAVMEIKSEP